uniref:MIF4G domain-containing protein n=1 Tax=Panagrolaimus davidi TaxID=227884 RepID=A0A914P3Y1_9BILA
MTANNYDAISVEIINKCDWKNEKMIAGIVELILNKAFDESMLIAGLYVNLFLALNYAEEASEADNFKHHFHREIIQTLQRFFEEIISKNFHGNISDEDLKYRMIGIFKVISLLFKVSMINFKFIEDCMAIFIYGAENHKIELMIEYAAILIKLIRPILVQRKEDTSKMDGYIDQIGKFKDTFSNRIKIMIVDLTSITAKLPQSNFENRENGRIGINRATMTSSVPLANGYKSTFQSDDRNRAENINPSWARNSPHYNPRESTFNRSVNEPQINNRQPLQSQSAFSSYHQQQPTHVHDPPVYREQPPLDPVRQPYPPMQPYPQGQRIYREPFSHQHEHRPQGSYHPPRPRRHRNEFEAYY